MASQAYCISEGCHRSGRPIVIEANMTRENVEVIAMHTRGVGYFAVGARLLKSTSDAAAR